jgi:tetratricopeptide (TPR) repeat protein
LQLGIDINSDLARFYMDLAVFDKLLNHTQEEVRLAGQMADAYPARPESQDSLAEAQVSLGLVYKSSGDFTRAEQSFRSALAIRQRLVEQNPNNTGYQRSLLIAYGHIGDLLGLPENRGLDRLPEAVEAFDKAGEIAESMVRLDPANRVAQADRATALNRSAACLLEMPDGAPRALANLSRAKDVVTNLSKTDPSNQQFSLQMLAIDGLSGKGLIAVGRLTEAAYALERARASSKAFQGGHSQAIAQGWFAGSSLRLAQIKAIRGDRATALALTEETIAAVPGSNIPKYPWGYALFCSRLGSAYMQIGRSASAAEWFQKSVEEWRKMKVPPALETKRQKVLAEAEHDLAAARRGHA